MTKDKILYYLRRRMRDLEDTPPSHASMAASGLGYAERVARVKHSEVQRAEHEAEVEALTEAIRIVEEHARC